MPELLPFAGLRFDTGVAGPLSQLTCPPYDVISDAQRRELAARSPYNVVRVELPEGRYQEAATLLRDWEKAGVLRREAADALYGYRMTYRSSNGQTRSTVGVVGALVLEPPGRGILPHEQTTPKAKTDRLELLRAARANTSPIWCLCSEVGLADAVGRVVASGVAVSTDEAGNRHEIWPLSDPTVHDDVARVVGAAPLLVADGHHRYETALTFQEEQGGDAGASGGGPSAVMALVVELSDQHLEVRAIHRVVRSSRGILAVADAFRADYDLAPFAGGAAGLLSEMAEQGCLGLVTQTGALLARPRPGTAAAALPLDSSRADLTLQRLGGDDYELSYEHDPDAAFAAAVNGTAQAAVLCRPASVSQIAATGHGGERMPPKTTFFWPKPLTGMVLRAW